MCACVCALICINLSPSHPSPPLFCSGRLTVDEALEHQWLRAAPTPAQPPPLVPPASASARSEGHGPREPVLPPSRSSPTGASPPSPTACASPRSRRHRELEAASASGSGAALGRRKEGSPRPSSPSQPADRRAKLHVSNFSLRAASATLAAAASAAADLSTKAKCFPVPSRLCRERTDAATHVSHLTKDTEGSGASCSLSPSREPVAASLCLSKEPVATTHSLGRETVSLSLTREAVPASLNLSLNREPVTTSLSLNREADGTWRTTDSVNKENNKNSINKTEEAAYISSPCCKDVLDSPSRPRSRFVHAEIAKRDSEAKKLAGCSKEGKENKENGRETKDSHREKLKPSPLCLRRQSSKCDLHSPTEQQKFGPIQGSVTKRIEKGMIY